MVPWTIVSELDMVSPSNGEVVDTANGMTVTVTLAVAVPPGPLNRDVSSETTSYYFLKQLTSSVYMYPYHLYPSFMRKKRPLKKIFFNGLKYYISIETYNLMRVL